MKLKLILVFIIVRSILPLQAQKIEQFKPEVDKINKKVILNYRIEDLGKSANMYEINLYYSQDSGKNYVGPLEKISGDVGKEILMGEHKQIEWKYLDEKSDFNGIQTKFKIVANYQPIVLGGPGNALFSALLPGLGNPKVRYRRWSWGWTLTTFSTFALIGAGIYMDSESQKNYDAYTRAKTINEANQFFSLASSQNLTSTILFGSAAVIWLSDITRVFIKGLQNKKLEKRLLEKNNKNLSANVHLGYDFANKNPSFGLKLKF